MTGRNCTFCGSNGASFIQRRRGFTLIELLVVITIILIVSAVALPTVLPALSHRQVSEGARILQAALAGARDAAIRDNAPSGIRLIPDPTFSGLNSAGLLDGSLPLAYNRIIPIESAPDYSEGQLKTIASTFNYFGGNASTGVTYPNPNGGGSYPSSVLTVVEKVYNPSGLLNPPTSWFWNVRVGDKIQINNSGPWYTIAGPMVNGPDLGNSELFVNIGAPGTVSPVSETQSGNKVNPEFLFLVNSKDDNQNGWIDEGWDGVDNNNNGTIDEVAEWENETWVGSLATTSADNAIYTIERRPIPTTNAREVSLPSGVVIDATSWAAAALWLGSPERTRVPSAALNIFSGVIEVLINPDGTVVPTTLYSTPASLQMDGSFYHFWVAERGDVYAPVFTTPTSSSTSSTASLVSGYGFALPMPQTAISEALGSGTYTPGAYATLVAGNQSLPYLKGEVQIITLFTRSGAVVTNQSPTFNVLNVSQPYFEAQQGVSGGQE